MSGTAFNFARLEIPCPSCGHNDLQLIRELVANDTVDCRYCKAPIDLEQWRAVIDQAAEVYKQIKILRP